MKRIAFGAVALILVLGGCGKKAAKTAEDPKPGGATAEAAVLRFVRAAAKRNLAAAKRALMTEAQCKHVPEKRRAECPDYVKRLHVAMPRNLQRVPRGFVPGKVTKDSKMPTGAEVSFYRVISKDGDKSIPVVVMPVGGRFYVVVPVRMKNKKKPGMGRPPGSGHGHGHGHHHGHMH